MIARIGGELEISAHNFLASPIQEKPFDFKKEHVSFVDTGRSALLAALHSILENGGCLKAWVPFYCCDSILKPFLQLDFKIHFYTLGPLLQSTEALPAVTDGATFLFIHYFGKKNNAVLQWLKGFPKGKRSFFVIEDCVQASLNTNIGDSGDYAFFSYRKFIPQPDGAALSSDVPPSLSLREPDEEFINMKLTAKILRGGGGDEKQFLTMFEDAEKRIDNTIIPRKMSWISRYLCERTDLAGIRTKRVDNYNYLAIKISQKPLSSYLDLLFEKLDTGDVPLGLPVILKNNCREALRRFLASRNIFCPIHWEIADRENMREFDQDAGLSKSILTIPIDQRMSRRETDHVVDQLLSFFHD